MSDEITLTIPNFMLEDINHFNTLADGDRSKFYAICFGYMAGIRQSIALCQRHPLGVFFEEAEKAIQALATGLIESDEDGNENENQS